MVKSFKIYTYPPPETLSFDSEVESLFYSSLIRSNFITQNPEEAHLFFIPFTFHSDLSTKSAARLVGDYRADFIYWNRTLGADHFFLSCPGVGHGSKPERCGVEEELGSDLVFPDDARVVFGLRGKTCGEQVLFVRVRAGYIGDRRSDEFRVRAGGDYGPSDPGHAFDDLLKWQRIAVFVGTSGGAKEIKRVLGRVVVEEYEDMMESAAVASKHFVWNQTPQPFDAFHMVMYQLWLRRHTIRYAERESGLKRVAAR
ncbi:Integral membrane Yip1 family protein [Hibiscus syriacus]|uniref:Integral membrane Yip1 family protein n=1 Tax=Hibiscus syriacus TaxID=106335 RepID=A0A6A2XA25_HIBSY|nr:Integral membrane Yip1 family protein [Hibiscus syriacus]